MPMAMPMIVVMPMILMQNPNQNEVENQTEDGGREHNFAFDFIFYEDPLNSFDEEPNGEREQENNRGDGANNLRSVPTERVLIRPALLGQGQRHNAHNERDQIGSQMSAISCNCDGIRHVRTNTLGGHKYQTDDCDAL